ncbi:MAG: TRAP transporter permease [Ectothiorhodospiraceae bacterium]|nr:TRAP transporter permease [Ectothiorhodospiraceae bacterium]
MQTARHWSGVSAQLIVSILAIALAAFHLYTAASGLLSPLYQRGTHLIALLVIGYLLYGVFAGRERQAPGIMDWLPAIAAAVIGIYLYTAFAPANVMERGIMGPTQMDIWVGIALMGLILEGTRRTVGLPIVLVALAFLAYGLFGTYMPEFISHRGYSMERLTTYLMWSTEGVFGTPLAVSATFVVIFIIFGAFMDRLGAGALFIDLAVALTGRIRGGPALTSVLGSGMMGSINGSSVSNVVTTGTFTIPLMKRTGYKPVFAGGVEAVASTGGQIMPPIMGAGAFVMAEMIGIPYSQIALFAIVPALLYFISIGLMVYFEAHRRDIPVLGRDEIPPIARVLAQGFHLLLPLLLLVYLLVVQRWSPMLAGVYAIGGLVAVASLMTLWRERRLPWKECLAALRQGITTAVPVALACACAGIVIGLVSMTGLGVRFTQLIVELSGGGLWIGAGLTMIACIILGMGLPTTAAYIITAVLGAPALIELGVPLIAAHMFIFYFAIISFITPPVGLSAYAASGIAGTNPIATSIAAFKLGIAGFIVPFVFIYSPALLLQGSIWEILLSSGTALLGVSALAAAIVGWFCMPLPAWLRLIFLLSAIALVVPIPIYGVAGATPLIAVALVGLGRRRRLLTTYSHPGR